MREQESTNGLFATISKRIELLEKVIDISKRKVSELPQGSIYVTKKSGTDRWQFFCRNKGDRTRGMYLGREKNKLIDDLCAKKYYMDVIKLCSVERKQLLMINIGNDTAPDVMGLHPARRRRTQKKDNRVCEDSLLNAFLKQHKEIRKRITPFVIDDETYTEKWLAEPYEGLAFQEDDTTSFMTEKGERVRSKSEVMIANTLYKYGIPYKYEFPVMLNNGRTAYPDFTVLLPKKRKMVYWEHLGKMGDYDYVARNLRKLDDYKKVGIHLGVNLIVTYENSATPLGNADIMVTINAIYQMDE